MTGVQTCALPIYRSNVRDFAWNAAVGLEGDNFEDNQRCHLELRGYIEAGPEGELQQ